MATVLLSLHTETWLSGPLHQILHGRDTLPHPRVGKWPHRLAAVPSRHPSTPARATVVGDAEPTAPALPMYLHVVAFPGGGSHGGAHGPAGGGGILGPRELAVRLR